MAYVKCEIIKFYQNTKGWWYYECEPIEPCIFKHIFFYNDAAHAMGKTKDDYKIGQIVELEVGPQVLRIFEPRIGPSNFKIEEAKDGVQQE